MSGGGSSDRRVWLAGGLLLLSGAASLTLEVVWTRLLQLQLGASALAVSTILFAYMLGLGLGALAGGRLAHRLRCPIRAYGLLELATAAYAVAVPALFSWLLPALRPLLVGLDFSELAFVRFLVAAALLIGPTLLMGATLPVLVAALTRRRSEIARQVGLLYGLNTLGAVAGVLAATFAFFPTLGLSATNLVGAATHGAVGLAAVGLGSVWDSARKQAASPARADAPARRVSPGVLSYALVGFAALAYEVIWTRALSMILGSSIHAFAVMLATFLCGVGLGSLLGRRVVSRAADPWLAYAVGVALLAGLSAATGLLIGWLPGAFLMLVEHIGPTPGALIWAQLGVAALAMLLPCVALGALFPLVTHATAAEERAPAPEVVGKLYFANTLGAALGAFATGFLLVPALGLRRGLGLTVALNLCTAAALLVWRQRPVPRVRNGLAGALLCAAVACVVFPPAWDPDSLLGGAYRQIGANLTFGVEKAALEGVPEREILFYRDGFASSVAVTQQRGTRSLRVNGKTDASDSVADMPTQVLLAHVPLLFGPPAERVLVIGLGAGVTATSASLYGLEHLDIVEIEPAVVEAAGLFAHVHARPLESILDSIHIDDARGYLQYTDARYDVIISEPSNPWMTGVSGLFTREFFRIARAALRPGGRLAQWVELYGLAPDELGSIVASLVAEFRYVYTFAGATDEGDLILLAAERPLTIRDLPRWEAMPEAVRRDLERIGTFSTAELWSLARLGPDGARALAAYAPVPNSDDNLYVELNAPWNLAINLNRSHWAEVAPRGPEVFEVFSGAPAETLGEVAEAYARLRRAPALGKVLADRARQSGAEFTPLLVEASWARRFGDLSSALRLLERAVALRPANALARWRRAGARLEIGDATGAVADARAALGVRPDDPRALTLHVRALDAAGRSAEAIHDVRRLLESPYVRTEPALEALLGAVALRAGDLETAIALQRRVTQRHPGSPAAWRGYAEACAAAGLPEEAARARRNRLHAEKNRVLELHRQARLATWAGNPSGGVELLRRVLTLDPDYHPARVDLARLELAKLD